MAVETFMENFSEYIRASKDVVDLMKGVIGLFPKGKDRSNIEAEIEKAERALKMAEANIAKSLGYELCRCTFPPQIMLVVRHHPRHDAEISECPKCKRQDPSEHSFQQMDRVDAYNTRGGDF